MLNHLPELDVDNALLLFDPLASFLGEDTGESGGYMKLVRHDTVYAKKSFI